VLYFGVDDEDDSSYGMASLSGDNSPPVSQQMGNPGENISRPVAVAVVAVDSATEVNNSSNSR